MSFSLIALRLGVNSFQKGLDPPLPPRLIQARRRASAGTRRQPSEDRTRTAGPRARRRAYADGGAALIGRPGPLHDVLSRDDPAAAVELMVYPLARILDTGLGGRSHTIEGTLGWYRQGLRSAIS